MKRIRISWQIDWCFWIFHLPCTQISMAWFMPLFHLYILRAFFVIWPCEKLSPAFEWGRETKRVRKEFDGQSTGVFGFSIYRAHKFLWRDLCRYFTCIYYERFLWYGYANNLARLLNEEGKLSVLVENLMANRLVFLDFPSTVHTNLCLP